MTVMKPFYVLSPAVQYPHFCMWPDKVHDHFRDGLYHSPLSYVASRYCTVLYSIELYFTVMYCIVLYSPG